MKWPDPSILIEWCSSVGSWPDIWYAVGFADAVQGFAFNSGGFADDEACDEATSYRNGWWAGRSNFPRVECHAGEHDGDDEVTGATVLRETYSGATPPTFP